ncbi:MAG TPA: helix-turn-helix domain-containing protein [Roseiflexaceae bacterium]|nr:helix-turn-helix domain-containing protein [Roseiflexaceae bacterium]
MDNNERGGARRAARVDARQNRARILAAARVRFAADGIDAQIDDIAREAEVAVGTIYHHFGSKDALLEAIVHDRFQRMADHISSLRDEMDAWAGVEQTLRYIAERQVHDRALKAVILSQPALREASAAGMREVLIPAIRPVLERAQAAGQVRADVVAGDLPLLLAGLPGSAAEPTDRERYLEIILAGLRTGGDAAY